ncbi:ABC transporter ATP-binding protein [Acidihalobacter ferrooxydans]|uniref:ABC transporter ATP-binding protein n=1 Tax=Acidihalobacter ferrooxydans TaxID=1765967 RepID=A0A1P8UE52_9GAMM|nr:ATP-binding cassette domain-containing protein [Acidihalobacter ferrooxydans]APZ42068.1 ABC transporter ATP-binding protein [Acidihalobacter ferrooxydans]
MSATPLLHAQGLARYYGKHRAIEGISLDVSAGEVLGLLGPNGAGKSTTMGLLSGCLAPSAGQIVIDGVDLLERPKRAKRHIGYLPEHPPLYDDLCVDEYLRYAARLHGMRRAQLPAALQRAKQRTGLDAAGRALIGTLSKGFRQRVGIAQALIHQPGLIILDEPTVGLDPLQIREIRELIGELRAAHAVILSTHILAEVQAVCDRVHIINRGRTVFADTLANLAGHTASSLIVAFGAPPDVAELTAIAGIQAAHVLGGGRFRLEHDSATSPGSVAQTACDRGWQLRELRAERQSLEQVFMRAVYAETHEDRTP